MKTTGPVERMRWRGRLPAFLLKPPHGRPQAELDFDGAQGALVGAAGDDEGLSYKTGGGADGQPGRPAAERSTQLEQAGHAGGKTGGRLILGKVASLGGQPARGETDAGGDGP